MESNHKNKKKQKKLKKISLNFFLAITFSLMLLTIISIASQEIKSSLSIETMVRNIRAQALPKLIKDQSVLSTIESLHGLAEMTYATDDYLKRRSARTKAEALSQEIALKEDPFFQQKATDLSVAINKLALKKDSVDENKNKFLEIQKKHYETLKELTLFSTEIQEQTRLLDSFFSLPSTIAPEKELFFPSNNDYLKIYEEFLVVLNDFTINTIKKNQNKKEQITKLKTQIDTFVTETINLKTIIYDDLLICQLLWEKIDLDLIILRNSVASGTENDIDNNLSRIQNASHEARSSTLILYTFLLIFILFYFIVIQKYITIPLRRTSNKLKDIQKGNFKANSLDLKDIDIKEIHTLAVLLDQFSEHLSELYKRADQLQEDVAQKKDLEEVMKAVFKASLDGYVVWNKEKVEKVSSGILTLLSFKSEILFMDYWESVKQKRYLNQKTFEESYQLGILREELILEDTEKNAIACEVIHLPLNFHNRPCILSYIRDLRNQKKTEKELLKAKEEAEVATEAKSEFLANMSHEIRTPMNAILGLIHLILQSELSPQQKEYITRTKYAAQTLLHIIDDILDFSKIEAGQMTMEEIYFDLEVVLKNMVDLNYNFAHDKSLELILNFPVKITNNLIGDPVRLNQVLNNLVHNAIKFTKKGEITISVSEISKNEHEVEFEFKVSDSGIGLTEKQIKKLFTAFTQADASTTRQYGGTGLGLAISKNLVEMMHGEIKCTSEPNYGSVFSFTAKFGIATEKLDHTTEKINSFVGYRALIVDDNIIALKILDETLTVFGFEVTSVTSGQEIINVLKEDENYDLIIIDWKMNDLDGLETVVEINKILKNSELPLVMMGTSANKEELQNKGKTIGVKKVITKPFSPSILFDFLMVFFEMNEKIDLKQQKEIENQKNPANLVKHLKNYRILLTEDNEINQLVARRILEKAGFIVDIANNGQEAINALNSGQIFDLVLMDIQMPILDGLEASKQIRENPAFQNLPIVAMTAHAMEKDKKLSLQAGMNAHIIKPIDLKNLFQTLAKWIPVKEEEQK